MLRVVFLTKKFYEDYITCPEIEQKEARPYVRIQVMVNGVLWAIPLRSHIKHEYAVWTDKKNCCGMDFTKAVVVTDPDAYISKTQPYIRPDEFKALKELTEYWVAQKMRQYIREYKRAKQNPQIPRNKNLLQYSTLQYFEQYI